MFLDIYFAIIERKQRKFKRQHVRQNFNGANQITIIFLHVKRTAN